VKAFEGLADHEIEPYLHLIDAMRETHSGCAPCSAKILAFCEIFTSGRSLPQMESYRLEYESKFKNNREDRNFRAEARSYIERLQQ
jgi:hypothetical protein